MSTPLVTAVMITGKDPVRIPLALQAVECFRQQSWPHKKLLIVTDGFSLIEHIPQRDASINQALAEGPPRSLGALRNLALEIICEGRTHAEDEYILQWDDDDWHHPRRMETQLAQAMLHPGHVVTLKHQIRCSFQTGNAFEMQAVEPCGLHGTILHPVTDKRYECVGKHEDSRFLKTFPHIAVYDNDPSLYIRFSHGSNTWGENHIMRQYAWGENRLALSPQSRETLDQVLPLYGRTPRTGF